VCACYHGDDLDRARAARRIDRDGLAGAAPYQRLADGRVDGDPPPIRVRFGGSDQVVFDRGRAGTQADLHALSDTGHPVGGRFGDACERECRLQLVDATLERRLLVERWSDVEVLAGLAAVLPGLAQPLGDLAPFLGDEMLELSLQPLEPLAGHRHRLMSDGRQDPPSLTGNTTPRFTRGVITVMVDAARAYHHAGGGPIRDASGRQSSTVVVGPAPYRRAIRAGRGRGGPRSG
jgi:hypothetical protein